MPSKEPQTISLEEFAELPDAASGKGGQARKVKWDDEVLPELLKKPFTNKQVCNLIHGNKGRFFYNEKDDDLNEGTVWTKLKDWVIDGKLRKVQSKSGHIFYGPKEIPA